MKADLVMGVGRVAGESLSHGVPTLSIKYNHLGPNFNAIINIKPTQSVKLRFCSIA